MQALILAITESGSVDRGAIRTAIADLSFPSALGTITWRGAGDNTTPEVNLVRVTGGVFVLAD